MRTCRRLLSGVTRPGEAGRGWRQLAGRQGGRKNWSSDSVIAKVVCLLIIIQFVVRVRVTRCLWLQRKFRMSYGHLFYCPFRVSWCIILYVSPESRLDCLVMYCYETLVYNQ